MIIPNGLRDISHDVKKKGEWNVLMGFGSF